MDHGGGLFPNQSVAAFDADARLDDAIHRLERTTPHASARRRIYVTQIIAAALLALAIGYALSTRPTETIWTGHFTVLALFFALIAVRLVAAAGSLAPEPPKATRWTAPMPVYTVLCPLYREAAVAPQLLAALARLDYPADKLDVKLILEAEDHETRAALEKLNLPAWCTLVIVPEGGPRTKPKALNYALAESRGAFVCVFDAEDEPHPRQLRAALDAFAGAGLDLGCVQAPLAIANRRDSWIAQQFAAEYAIQFRELLPLFARAGLPFLLGGTSNHFRLEALRACGGWDAFNVTEDADVGVRLARAGWRLGMISPPTWEDAPVRVSAWLRQRTRWIKGHIQTWLVLMRRPLTALRELGLGGFTAVQLQLGGAIVAAFAHAPLIAILAASALSPAMAVGLDGWAMAVAGYAIAIYGTLAAAAASRDLALAKAALTMPLYWPLATLAAICALIELARAPHYWAKTEHVPRAPRAADPTAPLGKPPHVRRPRPDARRDRPVRRPVRAGVASGG